MIINDLLYKRSHYKIILLSLKSSRFKLLFFKNFKNRFIFIKQYIKI